MRFAIIRADGQVHNVIVADEATATKIATDLGCTAREVVTELEMPATVDAIVSRAAQPGARIVERDAGSPDEVARSRARGERRVVDDFTTEPAPIEGELVATGRS